MSLCLDGCYYHENLNATVSAQHSMAESQQGSKYYLGVGWELHCMIM